jgi:hypothetical protein
MTSAVYASLAVNVIVAVPPSSLKEGAVADSIVIVGVCGLGGLGVSPLSSVPPSVQATINAIDAKNRNSFFITIT